MSHKAEGAERKGKVFHAMICALLLASAYSAHAQEPGKIYRIGYLSNGVGGGASEEAFRDGMRDLGYTEGKNLLIEWRHSKGKLDTLPELAAELARLNVDCIFSIGVETTRSAKQATTRIPIVMGDADDDPVRQGLIASLARPGKNVTGFISISSDLAGKRLGLLKDTLPQLSRVAILHTGSKAAEGHVKESSMAARALKLQLKAIAVSDVNEIKNAFDIARKDRTQALVIVNVAGMGGYQPTITSLAIKGHLPTMHTQSTPVSEGGLMSYAADVIQIRRRATNYVDKVVRGANPADLPVQQPTKFDFIINLKTAKQIGLTIPPNVLARADRVIK